MKDKEYLIALNMVSGLGSVKIKDLLELFKVPSCIFKARINELTRIKGLNKTIAGRIYQVLDSRSFKDEINMIKEFGVGIITLLDDDYPESLKHIYDPPAVLYVKGNIKSLYPLSVAIVGCRKASPYGLQQAQRMAQELAEKGACVVSGLARGIDTQAHKGALSVGGKTAAVLGSGFVNVYPKENTKLFEQISRQGVVISEFSLQTLPQKCNFPRRNRIISGLSKAVVVVEAAQRSGSLITANLALDQGRDVYAVPGIAGSIYAQGTNKLIKEGARLVENAEDVLESFLV
ncbi:MAG: DNA-protecting protein DprA [PVC group bacterium]|nr:DNA-protecting protein DprA [PVC group bacterium]